MQVQKQTENAPARELLAVGVELGDAHARQQAFNVARRLISHSILVPSLSQPCGLLGEGV